MNEVALKAAEKIHPLTGDPRAQQPKPRKELTEAFNNFWNTRKRQISATYDAARDSDEFRRYWANADGFDADSANNPQVRKTLRDRSRYEVANNGYADGIAQTYATHLVGATGPVLQMQTNSDGFNRMVEAQWFRWCDAVGFSRKFWCMAHAKHVDGEAFAVLRRNKRINHPVQYDLVLHEAEQCATPLLPLNGEPGYIDGIKFDQFSDDPIWYDFLRYHPGAQSASQTLDAERVPAEFVLHWFKLRRPGQHRGVPECASTLNTGAAARRWREAVLASAEAVADFTLFLKTQFAPDSEEMQYAADFSTQEISKRMMTALPVGYEPFQLTAEHPNAQYAEFHKQLVNEMARAKNMPYNVAACDSSDYNYASGRLDHQTYYGNLDSDRSDGSRILDKSFALWFRFAVPAFQWLGGDSSAINMDSIWHAFAWPKHRVADIQTEAEANKTKLSTGELTLTGMYADAGKDFEDELVVMARDYGKSPDEMRAILLAQNFPDASKAAIAEKAAARAAARPVAQPAQPQEEEASNAA